MPGPLQSPLGTEHLADLLQLRLQRAESEKEVTRKVHEFVDRGEEEEA